MYKLKIRLESDGDFYHGCSTVNSNNPEVNIYYNSRGLAIIKLRMFYSMLTKTIGTNKEYILDKIDTIKNFKDYLNLIIDKFDTFYIHFELGNIDLEMELCEVNPEVISGGGTIFKEENPLLILYPTCNFINEYNWDAVRECPNVIQEGIDNAFVEG